MTRDTDPYSKGLAWTTGPYHFVILSVRWSEKHGGRWFYDVQRTWKGRISTIHLPHANLTKELNR